MQIFDRNYRLFGVINVIDVVVVIAVLVAGFAVYKVLSPGQVGGTAGKAGQTIVYTVYCPAMHGITDKQVKVRDTIFKTTGKAMGTVTAVRVEPMVGEAWDSNTASIRTYRSSVLSDVYIDVTATGSTTKTGFAIGDVVLHGGQPLQVMTSTFESDTAFITTMTVSGQ